MNTINCGDKMHGRNLAGYMSGTLLGIFPKLVLTFRKLTQQEMAIVAPILDSTSQIVKYFDPTTQSTKTIYTYTGDWNYTNNRISNKNNSFECSFISKGRRT